MRRPRWARARRAAVRSALAVPALLALSACAPPRPNIVLLYTDDQRHDTLDVMPALSRLAREGVVFENSFVTTPVCGPSRAVLLNGRLASTQGITLNEGAPSQFDARDTLAVRLQEAGYRTALFGKYLNGYRDDFPAVPPGWSRWRVFADGILDLFSPGSLYRDPRMSHDGVPRREIGYSTDLLTDYAVEFIEESARDPDRPFFLMVSYWAPHAPFLPADRHAGRLAGRVPAEGAGVFEANMLDKPRWLREFARRSDLTEQRRVREEFYVPYLETLLAVDESVERIVATLEDRGLARDTLVIFTSDNGFAAGEHWWFGKGVPYEESIRVPLVAWQPGWVRPGIARELVANVDLAPTLTRLAGAREVATDGVSLVPSLLGLDLPLRRHVPLEWHRDMGLSQGYQGLRTRGFKYVSWEEGDVELYDLGRDPWELTSRVGLEPRRLHRPPR